MGDVDIIDLFEVVPLFPDASDRVNTEIARMKDDMSRLLLTWDINQVRSMFTGPFQYRCQTEPLRGETIAEQCRSALRIGGFTFLTDAIHLSSFDVAEQLRQNKLRVFTQLISRDKFFRPDNKNKQKKATHNAQNDVALFDLLRLPSEMIEQIMERSAYKDAQSLAVCCSAANDIYRHGSTNMILPDIVMVLDFSSGELNIRWWLAENGQDQDSNVDRILEQCKENDKKKNQLLKNTTLLKVVTTASFEPEHFEAVKNFLGMRTFKRIVVQGDEYNLSVKEMVEMFDVNCAEIEVDRLDQADTPFPNCKTITIHENLNRESGERLFAAKQFVNITCGLNIIDTYRKALQEWDCGDREIGHWVILKQFTIFQSPFGRRYGSETSPQKGYLQFVSELNSSKMLHGEITEFIYHPSE